MKDITVSASVLDMCEALREKKNTNHENNLNKLDQFTMDITKIQNTFGELELSSFYYSWDHPAENEEDFDLGINFSSSLMWDSKTGKILYHFSEEAPEEASPLLGQNMQIRLHCIEKIKPFFLKGAKQFD